MAFDIAADPAPKPLPANVRRYDADGKPTQAQIQYEARFAEWLKRLAAAIP